jgi:hypothetical protein
LLLECIATPMESQAGSAIPCGLHVMVRRAGAKRNLGGSENNNYINVLRRICRRRAMPAIAVCLCRAHVVIAENRSGEAGFYAPIIVAEQGRAGAQVAVESADAEPNRESRSSSRSGRVLPGTRLRVRKALQ